MSACRFTIDFAMPVEDLVSKAKAAIQGQGGVFNGDTNGGSFTVQVLGNIGGTYLIAGREMTVDIHTKPLFISCSQIENFMRNQFGG